MISLTIHVQWGAQSWVEYLDEPPITSLAEILQRVLTSRSIPCSINDCLIVANARIQPVSTILAELVRQADDRLKVWIHIPDLRLLDELEEDDIDLDDTEVTKRDEVVAAPPMPAPRSAPPGAAPSVIYAEETMRPRSRARFDSSPAPTEITRHITARYYERMNPQRIFPLLFILSKREIERIVQKKVGQSATGPVKMSATEPIEVEPVLPGCSCYPAKASIVPGGDDQTLTFWVVPEVLGKIPGASVRVRQGNVALADVALDMRVCKQTWAKISAVATLVLPFVSALAKHYRIDFESQLQDGFSVYLSVLNTITQQLSTPVLFAGLAMLTGILYWFTRPKKRDLFFDIDPKPTTPTAGS